MPANLAATGLQSTSIASGVLLGAYSGAVGGAVGGMFQGAANAIWQTARYHKPAENIIRDAAGGFVSGAVGGAIIGGVVGGIDAALKKLPLWTGNPKMPPPVPSTGGTARQGIVEPQTLEGEMPAWANPVTGEPIPAKTFTVVNTKLNLYPEVLDPRTGRAIPLPTTNNIVGKELRVQWGATERSTFIKDWYNRGYSTPRGGWEHYDIHHILPREYGGTNEFWNLVPVERATHQQLFNSFWRNFGHL